jgi:hypothetical protein
LIPQANITAWRASAPWADDAQVEQDLVLSRAAVELFADESLTGRVALRGGTSLHKLFLHPPHRYSEDIDLVQIEAGPIGSVIDAVRGKLDPWLGKPIRERGPGTVTLKYRFESEIPPVRPMRLKIEINTREHFVLLGLNQLEFAVTNPWFTGECQIATFQIAPRNTKIRSIHQYHSSIASTQTAPHHPHKPARRLRLLPASSRAFPHPASDSPGPVHTRAVPN